jgi:aminodeoxychorismate lyase
MNLDDRVWIDGRIVPAALATVSVFDRSFLYGDGLFETVRIANGRPFRWSAHMDRMEATTDLLRIRRPYPRETLLAAATALLDINRIPEGVVRLHLTRGVGRRGYSPAGADTPRVVIATAKLPEAASLESRRRVMTVARFPIAAGDPLAGCKSASRLPYVLARAEAEAAGFDEALLLNTDGHVVEAASANVFWVEGSALFTPPLGDGPLPGVTRAAVLEVAQGLGISTAEISAKPARLHAAAGMFLTSSGPGVVEVSRLDGIGFPECGTVSRIRSALETTIARETSSRA